MLKIPNRLFRCLFLLVTISVFFLFFASFTFMSRFCVFLIISLSLVVRSNIESCIFIVRPLVYFKVYQISISRQVYFNFQHALVSFMHRLVLGLNNIPLFIHFYFGLDDY